MVGRSRAGLALLTGLLTLCVLPGEYARAASLSPFALGPATNGNNSHSGVAGIPGHLYTVTADGQVEHSVLAANGTPGAWSYTSHLVAPARVYGIMATWGNHIYVAGGWISGCCVGANNADVEVATINPDGSLSSWTLTTPMLTPRANHAGAAGSGRLYMLGNYGGSPSVESAGFQPDGSLGPWRTESSMLSSRERPAAAVVGDFLYVIGGLPFTTTVERSRIGADGVLGSWEYVASTQNARYELGAASAGPFLFAVGGYNDAEGDFASVEGADSGETGLTSWSYMSATNLTRSNCDASAVGGTLYVTSGGTVEFASINGLDSDGDGVPDQNDNCPVVANPTQTNADGDGAGDACDLCPNDATNDADGDSTCEDVDNCPSLANSAQADADGDGVGDACDADVDGDGKPDASEGCMCAGSTPGAPSTPQGCDVNQVCPCAAPLGRSRWLNHREYIGCLRNVTKDLQAAGTITTEQRRTIIRAGALSACGAP